MTEIGGANYAQEIIYSSFNKLNDIINLMGIYESPKRPGNDGHCHKLAWLTAFVKVNTVNKNTFSVKSGVAKKNRSTTKR